MVGVSHAEQMDVHFVVSIEHGRGPAVTDVPFIVKYVTVGELSPVWSASKSDPGGKGVLVGIRNRW